MSEKVIIRYFMRTPHLSQVITGFCGLYNAKNVVVENHCDDSEYPYKSAILEVEYKNKILVYDMLDGYNDINAILYFLEKCDFYFKRSFSADKNKANNLPCVEKMYPLGLNYHVSCFNHPYDCHAWKEKIKKLLKHSYNDWCNDSFDVKLFEQKPKYKRDKFKVVFLARLWPTDNCFDEKEREEREYINAMRIEIVRALKDIPQIDFVGGLSDNDFTARIAPELIIDSSLVNRKKYIKLMKSADICIGSMGLYESIGWKTAEYVAASKAIVNEKMHYEVTGNFKEGENYIEFSSAQECIDAVKNLISNPEKIYQMKIKNHEYYNEFLRPNKLVENSLRIAGVF